MLLIKTEQHQDGVTLRIAGEIDIGSRQLLENAILTSDLHPSQSLSIDMSKVEFCDSQGIHTLIGARRFAEERSAQFRLVAPSPQTLRVVELLGLEMYLSVQHTAC